MCMRTNYNANKLHSVWLEAHIAKGDSNGDNPTVDEDDGDDNHKHRRFRWRDWCDNYSWPFDGSIAMVSEFKRVTSMILSSTKIICFNTEFSHEMWRKKKPSEDVIQILALNFWIYEFSLNVNLLHCACINGQTQTHRTAKSRRTCTLNPPN